MKKLLPKHNLRRVVLLMGLPLLVFAAGAVSVLIGSAWIQYESYDALYSASLVHYGWIELSTFSGWEWLQVAWYSSLMKVVGVRVAVVQMVTVVVISDVVFGIGWILHRYTSRLWSSWLWAGAVAIGILGLPDWNLLFEQSELGTRLGLALLAVGVITVVSSLYTRSGRHLGIVLLLSVVYVYGLMPYTVDDIEAVHAGELRAKAVHNTAEYVQLRTEPGERFLTTEPVFAVLSGRQINGAYAPDVTRQLERDTVLEILETERPAYIIEDPRTKNTILEYKKVRNLMKEEYQIVEQFHTITVWERKVELTVSE